MLRNVPVLPRTLSAGLQLMYDCNLNSGTVSGRGPYVRMLTVSASRATMLSCAMLPPCVAIHMWELASFLLYPKSDSEFGSTLPYLSPYSRRRSEAAQTLKRLSLPSANRLSASADRYVRWLASACLVLSVTADAVTLLNNQTWRVLLITLGPSTDSKLRILAQHTRNQGYGQPNWRALRTDH